MSQLLCTYDITVTSLQNVVPRQQHAITELTGHQCVNHKARKCWSEIIV